MSPNHCRHCQEAPPTLQCFLKTHTECTPLTHNAAGHLSWVQTLQKAVYSIPPATGEVLSDPVPSGSSLGLEPKGKESRKSGEGALILFLSCALRQDQCFFPSGGG